MRIGKERKRARRDRNANIFGVVKKYLIGEEMGKNGVIKVQNPYIIKKADRRGAESLPPQYGKG